MKQLRMMGVTLLEIMLVLAVAAMIIVMSVRYYRSATTNQNANSALQLVQAVTAAGDQLAAGSNYSTVDTATVKNIVGNLSLPWGGALNITTSQNTYYTVELTRTPAGICAIMKSKLMSNPRFAAGSINCPTSGSGTMTYSYYGDR